MYVYSVVGFGVLFVGIFDLLLGCGGGDFEGLVVVGSCVYC